MHHHHLCFAFLGLFAFSSCDVERPQHEPQTKRDEVEQIFVSQIGIKEATGQNDGPEVEAYLAATGLGKGNPWCAAFCSWCFTQANVPNPKSAYSPDWFRSNIVYHKNQKADGIPQKGDVFGIYFQSMNRVAHVGFIQKWDQEWVVTVEGNSNDDGSRDGYGVFKRRRLKSQIYAVSSWVD